LTAVLDGIRRAKIPAIELSEISELFRLIDRHNNYAFYREQLSKKSEPVLPFLLPYFQASTMDPMSGLIEFFQFVPYFAWRQQRGKLVEGKSELLFTPVVPKGLGIKGVGTTLYNAFTAVSAMLIGLYHRNRFRYRTQHPDSEQCFQISKSSANSTQSGSSRIQLLSSTHTEVRQGQSESSNIHKLPRVFREPRLRRKQAYCCNCKRERKCDCRDMCQCQHIREGCDACLDGPTLATEPLNPGKIVALDRSQISQSNTERIRASLALQSLLIRTSVSFSEICSVIDQLSSEECRLLSCTREEFSQKEFLYRFAVGGTGAEEEDMRKVGALYNPSLTVEELCKLWNCLLVS
jgi:hypothetical protein